MYSPINLNLIKLMSKKFLNLRAMDKHPDLLIPHLIGGAVGGLHYLVAGALGQSWVLVSMVPTAWVRILSPFIHLTNQPYLGWWRGLIANRNKALCSGQLYYPFKFEIWKLPSFFYRSLSFQPVFKPQLIPIVHFHPFQTKDTPAPPHFQKVAVKRRSR